MALKSPLQRTSLPSSQSTLSTYFPTPNSTTPFSISLISPLSGSSIINLQQLLSNPIALVKEMKRSLEVEQPASVAAAQRPRKKMKLEEYTLLRKGRVAKTSTGAQTVSQIVNSPKAVLNENEGRLITSESEICSESSESSKSPRLVTESPQLSETPKTPTEAAAVPPSSSPVLNNNVADGVHPDELHAPCTAIHGSASPQPSKAYTNIYTPLEVQSAPLPGDEVVSQVNPVKEARSGKHGETQLMEKNHELNDKAIDLCPEKSIRKLSAEAEPKIGRISTKQVKPLSDSGNDEETPKESPSSKKRSRSVAEDIEQNEKAARKKTCADNSGFKYWKAFPKGSFQNLTASGIENLGNWCYRNSTIQALLHVPALYDFFANHHNRDSCELDRKGCISCLLGYFAKYHFSDSATPNGKAKVLGMIDQILGGDFGIKGFRHAQQDADEYATLLLDKAVEQLKGGNKNAKTPLEDILDIGTLQSVVCANAMCKHISRSRSQTTTMRAKMIKSKTVVHLKNLIQNTSETEYIKDYKCEKCGFLGAKIHRKVAGLPPALMVHVNRGAGARVGGRGRIQTSKIHNWLKFDPEMELKSADGSTHKYTLKSVISHQGTTLQSGHYVSFVRNPDEEGWSFCSDHHVAPAKVIDFRGGNRAPDYHAYILIYAKL